MSWACFLPMLFYVQNIPKWWIWCYYLCPTSWSLNGFLTSQYGDIDKEISIFGELKTVSSFLQDYYGFRHDHLGIVAAVLAAFPVAFAFLFAYCIGKSNFQRRWRKIHTIILNFKYFHVSAKYINDHTLSKLDSNWAAPCICKPLWVAPR
jgi:hypothetical protein